MKIRKSSFVEGTLIATLVIFITKLMGIIYVIPFYKMIGVEGSSLYSYIYNVYVIFLDISITGLPIAVSKLINEYDTLGFNEAKLRAFKIANKVIMYIVVFIFLIMFIFSDFISYLIMGEVCRDVSIGIKVVSFSILIIPYLSIIKGFYQGLRIINVSSFSQVIEQIVRITFILLGTYLVLYVFHGSMLVAICISVFGSFVGGLVAYGYLRYKLGKLDNDFSKKDSISNKEILKKLFMYAIPFIVINIISSCYNFIDMTLLVRTLNHFNIGEEFRDFCVSSVTTWAPKLNMIITAVAMGMSTSLIPTMVNAFTLSKWDVVNSKFNQAINILLYISLPLIVFISINSDYMWSIFYNSNEVGFRILSLNVWLALMINLFMTVSSVLQGLNRFKVVYIITFLGFFINSLLDVPIMFLYNKIGIPIYLGTITASIIGYMISIVIGIIYLCKKCNVCINKVFIISLINVISIGCMIIVIYVLRSIFIVDLSNKLNV